MANQFRGLLKNHKQATLAGQYGQFEHAFNFLPPADSKFKIGPGENITFEGELTTGAKVQLVATNDLTGPSGQGFQAQETSSPDGIIVVGDDPSTGQATLEFTLPGSGAAPHILSFHDPFESRGDEWFAQDENENEIFRKAARSGAGCIHRSAAPDDAWYVAGTDVFGDRTNKYDAAGNKIWGSAISSSQAPINYDPSNDTVLFWQSGSLRGIDGATGAILKWETRFGDNFFTMVADEAGFLYGVMRSQNDSRSSGFPGNKTVAQSVFKIDTATGEVVASFNTNIPFSTGFRLQPTITRDPNSGEIFVCEPKAETGHDGTGPFAGVAANVYKFDSNLVLLAITVVAPVTAGDGQPIQQRDCTVDENGDLYILSSDGRGQRLTGDLTTVVWGPRILVDGRANVIPGRHNQAGTSSAPGGHIVNDLNGTLTISARGLCRWDNGVRTGRRAHMKGRYQASDGNFISCSFVPRTSSPTETRHITQIDCLHLRVLGGGAGGTGEKFTTELSQNPPGKTEAFAAVKYDSENISAIYFNSVDCEFDPTKWKATHSVAGPVSFNTQWTYNTSL